MRESLLPAALKMHRVNCSRSPPCDWWPSSSTSSFTPLFASSAADCRSLPRLPRDVRWQHIPAYYNGLEDVPPNCPFSSGYPDPHHGFLVPSESTPKTAPRSVQPFSQGSRLCLTDRHTRRHVTAEMKLWRIVDIIDMCRSWLSSVNSSDRVDAVLARRVA